jgi:hypothetical protein
MPYEGSAMGIELSEGAALELKKQNAKKKEVVA